MADLQRAKGPQYKARIAALQRLEELGLPRWAERRLLAFVLGYLEHTNPNLSTFVWSHVFPANVDPDRSLTAALLRQLETVDLRRGKRKDRSATIQLAIEVDRLAYGFHDV